jgi:hypothetical protein
MIAAFHKASAAWKADVEVYSREWIFIPSVEEK